LNGLRSGSYLLFTFLGGATFFFGPIIGAALLVFALVLLSELSKAWLLYVGLVFLLMVMFAPGGVASLIMMNMRVAMFGKIKRFYALYAGLLVTAAIMLAGAAAIVEMIYHMQLNAALGPVVPLAGLSLDTSSAVTWVVAVALLTVGLGLFEIVRRRFARIWGQAQEEIEAEIKRRERA
jgi:branched-chain amino acid transport system permease protein